MKGTRGSRYDLHIHSTCSDGRFTVDEVLERSAAGGLDVISLTDHDFASTLRPGAHRIGGHVLDVIPGAEISGRHASSEFHLLVYFGTAIPDGFRAFCGDLVARRTRRYQAALLALGLPDVPAPDEAARKGARALTRLHLAHALVAAGHARDFQDAFARFLSEEVGKVPPIDLPFPEAIRVARSFGGITSWAHPPLRDAKAHLETFVEAGLQGIEIHRPQIPGRERRALHRLARQHGLLVTGGSDWHGWTDPRGLGLYSVHGSEIRSFLEAIGRAP